MSEIATQTTPKTWDSANTAVAVSTVAGLYSLVSYGFDCQHAHAILKPTLDQFGVWAALFAAPAHEISTYLMSKLRALNAPKSPNQ